MRLTVKSLVSQHGLNAYNIFRTRKVWCKVQILFPPHFEHVI